MVRSKWAVAGILVLASITSALGAPRASVDPKVAMIAGLDYCESATQFDCIESLTVIDKDGTRYAAKRAYSPSGQSLDSYGQVVEETSSDWNYTNKAGKVIALTVEAALVTPAFVVGGSAPGEPESAASPDPSAAPSDTPPVDPNTLDTRTYDPRMRIAVAFIDTTPGEVNPAVDRPVELVVRTSWLKVAQAEMPGRDATLSVSNIEGGSKVTIRGSRIVYYQEFTTRSQLTGEISRRIVGSDNFLFDLTHGFGDSAECAKAGAVTSNTNAVTMSIQDLVDSKSIGFRVTGVKTTSTGGPNLGFLNVRVPLAWLTCKDAGNLLQYGTKFDTSFLYGDGSRSDGKESASVSISDGALVMKFDNFPFAKTEIKVSTDDKAALAAKDAIAAKAKAEAEAKARADAEAAAKAAAEAAAKAIPTPTPTPVVNASNKKTTITCIKGKTTKKVTAVNPKCPAGYKKR